MASGKDHARLRRRLEIGNSKNPYGRIRGREVPSMAAISDIDRSAFENLCKGIHDFDEQELARLHEAAEAAREIVKSANARQQKRMGASFKQMG
jgi:hypothetical protein